MNIIELLCFHTYKTEKNPKRMNTYEHYEVTMPNSTLGVKNLFVLKSLGNSTTYFFRVYSYYGDKSLSFH